MLRYCQKTNKDLKKISTPAMKPPSSSSSPPPPLYTLLFLLLLVILGFYALHRQTTSTASASAVAVSHSDLFLSLSTNATVSSYLRHLTLHAHLAGTPASDETADYVYSHFKTLTLNPQIVPYTVLLSYPITSSVSVHFRNGTSVSLTVTDDKSGSVVTPYHAYSPSGSALAEPVYVNHGCEEDYRALDALGVSVKGRVVLVRKGGGGLSRGAAVRIAAREGAAAAILFGGGGGGGVERGTVMNGMGDPLSPGFAAVEGGERLEENEVFPKIPSIPISAAAADVILGSLGGPAVPTGWESSGGSGLGQRVGPGPTLVNLTYLGEKKERRIQNVFAVIRGLEEPDRYVILGNHRDAWTYGAVDPNSGTAALLDIARRFSNMLRNGWRPRRTIVLSSWDGEEFGMVGSTEWVEQNLVNLGGKAVAYLNVDCAVQGPGFNAASTPQLDDLLFEVTRKVKDPDFEGAMLYEKWASKNQATSVERLSGAFSDFAPFLQHGGIPSVDIYYGKDFPVYHTAFDSYDWIVKHADPLFHRHVAVAEVWGLVALRLADDPVLPFNYLSYAQQLSKYEKELSILLDHSNISLHPLASAIEQFASAAEAAAIDAKVLQKLDSRDALTALKQRALNDRLMLAERGFLDADGIQGRHWFKHLIYGPHGDYESKLDFFPGIADAIREHSSSMKRDEGGIQHQVWRVSRAVQCAANALRGELFP
ncbi:Probable glutamate carboxypeptidase AMP1 [Linum perenne]